MDAIDNPDHGRRIYTASGVTVVDNPFNPAKATHDYAPAPAGGPNFPTMEDSQIAPVPS